MLHISSAPLRVRLVGNPWLCLEGDGACLVRLLRANRPRPLAEPEVVEALARCAGDIAQLLFLSGSLGSIIQRAAVRQPGSPCAKFYYRLHPDVRFEVPPALVPGTTIPHEDMGGRLEPDALDRLTAEIHGLTFAEGL